MPIININSSNAAISVPSGYDAFLGSTAVNDTISLAGADTLHGGLDLNSNTVNTSGGNTINVINATINETGGSSDTINGKSVFNDISLNGIVYSGTVSLVGINSSDNSLNVPYGYGVLLNSGSNNDTITLVGNDTLHGGLDQNSNTINTFGNNVVNVNGATTINGTGSNDVISGRNIVSSNETSVNVNGNTITNYGGTIYGGFNEITLNGNGNNTVYSGAGSLVIDNGTGNDRIFAQSLIGEHKIYLGSGNDTLEVQDGVSGPQVSGNLDNATVFNFVSGRDVVALNTLVGAHLINAGNIANIMNNTFGYHGLYTELVLGGMSIIFQGVSSLHASDFILA